MYLVWPLPLFLRSNCVGSADFAIFNGHGSYFFLIRHLSMVVVGLSGYVVCCIEYHAAGIHVDPGSVRRRLTIPCWGNGPSHCGVKLML